MDNEVREVSPEELEKDLDGAQKYNIVDVRETEEVETGMIPGAKHLSLGTLPEHVEGFNKEEEYVMVCRSGRRSHNACLFLQEHGIKAYNLQSGMLDWTGEKVF
ncbi:rhodanese-like domain-containing protein [Halalkalibacillus halophilus]|uniref:rhodanese-like domain-containing protein n=1 Tax=Halalkalibacillus halophilus TaxID=392827 RepID=UPI0004148505|nr:rhodanese-like domain-containing protein [Halalkalibacillus halophilus]